MIQPNHRVSPLSFRIDFCSSDRWRIQRPNFLVNLVEIVKVQPSDVQLHSGLERRISFIMIAFLVWISLLEQPHGRVYTRVGLGWKISPLRIRRLLLWRGLWWLSLRFCLDIRFPLYNMIVKQYCNCKKLQ